MSGRPGRRVAARYLVAVLGMALAAALVASSDLASYGVRAATAALAGVTLLAGPRRRDALAGSRRLLVAGLGAGALSGLVALGYRVAAGRYLAAPSLVDVLHLLYVPLAVAGLLRMPSGSLRAGHRVRALADGAVAATALWYLVVHLVLAAAPHPAGPLSLRDLTQVAYPAGDMFVIGASLSMLPRVVDGARRVLLPAMAGVLLFAVADIWFALGDRASTTGRSSAHGPAGVLSELGLALVVVAAAGPAVPRRVVAADQARPPTRYWSLAVPFVPVLACMLLGLRTALAGAAIPNREVLPILLIALALVVRQTASTLDTGRLIAELRRREQRSAREALHDELTGLVNRAGLHRELAAALADPTAAPVAVALLDLDDFKEINDTHGHDTGDAVLVAVAGRLRAAVRPGDMVARLGGDEFMVVARGVTDGAAGLTARLAGMLDEPVSVGPRSFLVRPSVGAAVAAVGPGAVESAAALMAHADVAMYRAKGAKRRADRVPVVLHGAARAEAAARLRLREEVADPDLGQFAVVYQPVVDLADGRIRGAEALLRWHHPQAGEISPAEFIPLAEGVGSIGRLGEFVLATALADLGGWTERLADRLAVGVNVSPRQLADPELAARVRQRLAAHRLDPAQLVVEVTEEALADDLEAAVLTVSRLRAAGVSVAVDDFGTGFSSLRYLQRFAVDVMKVDQSFIAAMPAQARTVTLVESVIAMGHALGLQTIAEGIETRAQLQLVSLMGCQLGQGYLFSAPVSAAELAGLVAAGHRYPVTGAEPAESWAPAAG